MQSVNRTQKFALDPWSASSLLQKSIRRGDAALAKDAARIFFRHRGQAIWRRLITIALEDVGIAAPDLVAEVVHLGTNPALRSVLADDTVLMMELCERLATTPKDRSTDYLFCAAMKLPAGMHTRGNYSTRPFRECLDVASDPREPLLTRASAALSACTIDAAGHRVAGKGVVAEFLATMPDGYPEPLLHVTEQTASKLGHPFFLMLPILWSARESRNAGRVGQIDVPPPVEYFQGWPLYIFDKHTSVGKRALSRLGCEHPEIERLLSAHAPGQLRDGIVGMAGFYADGVPVVNRLDWRRSFQLQHLGFKADMTGVGCPLDGMQPILTATKDALPCLNAIRREILSRGRAGA